MIRYFSKPNITSAIIEHKSMTTDSMVVCVAPTHTEIESLYDIFNLDQDMVNDALDIYETPRIEQDQDRVFIYTRYCNPSNEEIATEPVTFVSTKTHLFVIFRQKSTFTDKLISSINCSTSMRTLCLLEMLETVNITYRDFLLKVSRSVLSVRSRLNKHDIDNKDFINFIDLEEDLNEIIGSLQSYGQVMNTILRGKLVKMHEDDIDLAEDVELNIRELLTQAESRKLTIASTREAYSTIMANNLNKTFKKLTSISIFMTIPTITSGLYGMNLLLPMSDSPNAFWYILLIVAGVITLGVLLFKRLKWL